MDERSEGMRLLYGADEAKGLVGVAEAPQGLTLWWRCDGGTVAEAVDFRPFLLCSHPELLDDLKPEPRVTQLTGDNYYRWRVELEDWKQHDVAAAQLSRAYRQNKSAYYDEPLLAMREPALQYLLATGRTHFGGMGQGELRLLYIGLRALSGGADYPDAAHVGDSIIAVGLSDGRNWQRVLTCSEGGEKALLEQLSALVAERDPDVIIGHDIFKSALNYIAARARQHKLKLLWGRDGSAMSVRTSRAPAAEKQLEYPRADIAGRSVVDTWFLATFFDIVRRELESFDPVYIANYLEPSASLPDLLPGWEIDRAWGKSPLLIEADLSYELQAATLICDTLAGSYFAQAQMLPLSLQDCVVRGNATKINHLLLREYLRCGQSVPAPVDTFTFPGGYTEIRRSGVIPNVVNVDVASLYPSIMLSRAVAPSSDTLGVFQPLLRELTAQRLAAKQLAKTAPDAAQRLQADARQAAFKIFINSFFGYLGAARMHWADPSQAQFITATGQEIVRLLAELVEQQGGSVIEIDTDGIYLSPPFDAADTVQREQFVKQLNAALSAQSAGQGITVELGGYYPAMLSYKVKNYALLDERGGVHLKGSGMKSRGLEPFLRGFIEQGIADILRGEPAGIEQRCAELRRQIEQRTIHIKQLAKTETIVDSLDAYRSKVEAKSGGASGRNRSAVYEVALRAKRPLRPGDMVSYYITGEKHTVKAFEAAKPLRDFDPANPDYNIAYYVKKLDENLKKVQGYLVVEASATGEEDAALFEE
jgi:DNA polymerase, archaea type